MITRSVMALSALLALPASAAWQLDSGASELHFLSTKNAQITEVHQFDTLSGSVGNDGKLTVAVPLSSVNTAIEIRNTRMQEKLFETAEFSNAMFTASLPDDVMSMSAGESQIRTIEGAIDLHGKNVATTFKVMINRLNDDTLTVSTVAPTVLNAGDFDLAEGVKMLQSIAGLDSITMAVPVTFAVTFDQQ
ncbi:YceI family protein [Salinimonas lutimaris]|uniref:YceI family protein n=1 Tax=Salinimonas lutimaris TaxID=914153 RepID=UPI0010C0E737|nr:YceI family protein [Salinimonas lutimaris]